VFFGGLMFDIFEKADKEINSQYSNADSNHALIENGEKIFVISIGGSILVDERPNAKSFQKIADSINALSAEGNKFVLVVGGGKTARQYIGTAKQLNANNFLQDEIGIQTTRLNAMLLLPIIQNVFPEILTNVSKAKQVLDSGKIPVFGGIIPSFTTDAVGALIAESLDGIFVNLSNVNGVYSEDPRQNPKAKFFPELSFKQLLSIIKKAQSMPGQHMVIDLPACLILKRSNIPTYFLNGNDLENFEAFVRGQNFKGTSVIPVSEADILADNLVETKVSKKLKKKLLKKHLQKEKELLEAEKPKQKKEKDEEMDMKKFLLH